VKGSINGEKGSIYAWKGCIYEVGKDAIYPFIIKINK